MKRSVILGSLASLAILSGFSSCGKEPVACDPDALMQNAQLCPDRESLGFAQEFNSGTFIGQKPQDTIAIRNGGIADLQISSATISGDPAFSLATEPSMLPASIRGNRYFYMRVVFAPTEARAYSAKITVQSNAENTPSREFQVSGCGVPTDGGTSPCYGGRFDAGTP
jgi:hypothetical protein